METHNKQRCVDNWCINKCCSNDWCIKECCSDECCANNCCPNDCCPNNCCSNDCCDDDCCVDDCCVDDCCINECCVDECCALAAVIQSVAMIEASLSSIICAEGAKIKKAVCLSKDLTDLIRINESVKEVIETISLLEESLKQKTVYAIEALREFRCDQD